MIVFLPYHNKYIVRIEEQSTSSYKTSYDYRNRENKLDLRVIAINNVSSAHKQAHMLDSTRYACNNINKQNK
jgi:hypothetical protein